MNKFYKQKFYKKYKDEIWGKIISKKFSYNRKLILLSYKERVLKNRLRIKTKFKYFRRGFLKHLKYTWFFFKSAKKRLKLFFFWKKVNFFKARESLFRPRVRYRKKRKVIFRVSKFKPLRKFSVLFFKNLNFLSSSKKYRRLNKSVINLYNFIPPTFFKALSVKHQAFYYVKSFFRANNLQFVLKKKLNLKRQKVFFYSVHVAAPRKKKKKRSLFGLKNIYYKKISLFFGFKNVSSFLKLYELGGSIWGKNKPTVLSLLETRLEVFLLRLNLFPSIYFVKRFISHGNVFVNNKTITYPSYFLCLNQIVSFNRKYYKYLYAWLKSSLKFKRAYLNYPSFAEVDYKLLVAMLIRYPDFKSLTKPMSFDLYTKFPTFHR